MIDTPFLFLFIDMRHSVASLFICSIITLLFLLGSFLLFLILLRLESHGTVGLVVNELGALNEVMKVGPRRKSAGFLAFWRQN